MPEVLSGDEALDARVRWVHVSDSAGVARLLNGGELLLSTGSGWPTEPRELEAFIAELVDAGIAGLVLELGVHYRYVPAVVEAAAREHGLALVALHREVKFVALTEAVHSRIISEQTAALRARDEVRERFTALSLRGSPADFIVHQLAQTLGAAVVLENLAHEVVASEVPPAAEEELFTSWEVRSRLAHRQHGDRRGRSGAAGLDEWLIVPVEARGIRWGHLIALPGPAHPAGRASVLEQGAIALALGRLADGDADEWVRIGRQRLVDGLLAGRFAGLGERGGPARGGRTPRRRRAPLRRRRDGRADTARGAGCRGSRPRRPRDRRRGARLRWGGLRVRRRPHRAAVGARRAVGRRRARVRVRPRRRRRGIRRPTRALGGRRGRRPRRAARLGAGGDRPGRGARGSGPFAGMLLRRADDRPLMRLVTSLRDDHRLLRHSERMLSPLIEYDLARGGDLLTVLGAMLAHPGNRTAAASASHLSRSVFYQRLALIGDLLGVDLDDGEALTALHLALLVRRSAAR